ncbi:MAG: alpha/beta hydrolase [Trueperaceae bacterium]|nr:alpha/beta hydrolase [Trueperaceae bacterium]
MALTLVGVTLVGAWLFSFEDNLVYFPTERIVATPADYGLAYESVTLRTQDGVRIAAWELPAAPSAPWLIYFHGNGQNISQYLPLTTRLQKLGLNVLSPDYRGYGQSEGTPSEQGLYLDALAAYQHLRDKGVAPEDIVLYGFSLGTGVAVDLAARVEVGAVVLEAPYTSLPEVARALYRIVPTSLMRNRFDSADKIARVDAPILFIHAQDDQTVPYSQGRRLFELAAEPKRFVDIDGGHIAMLREPVPSTVLSEIAAWIDHHVISR